MRGGPGALLWASWGDAEPEGEPGARYNTRRRSATRSSAASMPHDNPPADHGRARRFYEREGWVLSPEPVDDDAFGMPIAEYRRQL